MISKKRILLFSSLACLSVSSQAQDAHVHGIANINAVADQNTLLIHFSSPLANLVGFEHEAKTEAEKQAITTLHNNIQQVKQNIVLSDENCILTSVDIEEEHSEEDDAHHNEHAHEHHEDKHEDEHEEHDDTHHDDDHDHEHAEEHQHDDHDEGEHSDLEVAYTFQCEQPFNGTVAVKYFDSYQNLEKIQTQVISTSGQAQSITLTKDNATFEMK